MSKDFRALQETELRILKQVLQICREKGIRYYALGGTLLGAIRHKGFIPWDDDIDIGMPRPDYERFLAAAETALQEPYQIQTELNGKGEYSYYYARVCDLSVKVRRSKSESDVIIPAWIDVFPLDGVPEEEAEFRRWKRRCSLLYRQFMFSQFQYYYYADTVKGKKLRLAKIAIKKIFYTLKLENLINTRKSWEKLDRELKKNDYEKATRLINFCGYWGVKEMFPKSVYGSGKLYPFEDIMLNGPVDYDRVLTQMYGDYMTPPPESDRDHHSIELIFDSDSV